jgi:hypothetical protein
MNFLLEIEFWTFFLYVEVEHRGVRQRFQHRQMVVKNIPCGGILPEHFLFEN